MAIPPEKSGSDKLKEQRETIWQQASTWLSRTLAVTLVMVLPGILGSYLDKQWGISWLTPVGFALGLLLGTTGLIVLARKLTPQARGKPLSLDESNSIDHRDPNGKQTAPPFETGMRENRDD